jgi:hypothetical protein
MQVGYSGVVRSLSASLYGHLIAVAGRQVDRAGSVQVLHHSNCAQDFLTLILQSQALAFHRANLINYV